MKSEEKMEEDRYEIIRQAPDEGAFAKVYEAFDRRFQIRVALKELKAEHRNNQEILDKFYQEAQIIFDWNHTNIVRIIDLNREKFYFTLSYLPETLEERIRTYQGNLPLGQVIRLAIDAAKALVEMENRGVVHCDIKPANIMFDEKGNAVLTDFGIAVDVHQKLSAGWGTPPYVSPEQKLGEALDGRSDQYALGVLLYEITNGQPLAEEAITIRFTNKLLPQKLEQIIIRLTQANKEDRYPTATRLLNALNELRLEFRQKILENAEIYFKNGNMDLAATELSNYLKDVDPESHTIK